MKKNGRHSVLITGTSSGIGQACAEKLAQSGYKVYASVRNSSDYEQWLEAKNELICPVKLNVTDQESIQEAFRLIEADRDYPLFALVNNAGIGISGVVEATDVGDFRHLLEVNVLGVHAVTKTFLPLLRKSKGRIINMGSVAGFFASPGSSAYSASKFALRAYTDSLRIEMIPYGVKVIYFAPGAVESKIWTKSENYKRELRKHTSEDLKQTYRLFIKAGDHIRSKVEPIQAIIVANTIESALKAKCPKCYYKIGKEAREAGFYLKFPRKILDQLILKRIMALAKESGN